VNTAPDGELRRIRVLGPVDVLTTAGPTHLGGGRERTLLAALVLSANRAVSSDQLAQILWGNEQPPSRDNTLQTYISRLRHVVGHERIRSEEHSYALAVDAEEIDAVLFERLVSEAGSLGNHAAVCGDRCDRALGMWRGVAFGELADRDPFRLEAVRLDEIRLYAVELKMASEISLDREEIVVGALEALVEEHPYRERFWHLLITALALCGRRTEALRVCHELRGRLGEVGLEPAAAIRHLESVILTDDADLRSTLLSRHEQELTPTAPRGAG
jgi:DNA-binding SARP family transcriptional activator